MVTQKSTSLAPQVLKIMKSTSIQNPTHRGLSNSSKSTPQVP